MLLLDAVFFDCVEDTAGEEAGNVVEPGRTKAKKRWSQFERILTQDRPLENEIRTREVHDWDGERGKIGEEWSVYPKLREFFKLWQPHSRSLPDVDTGFEPMIVEFVRPYDKWEPGDTTAFHNPGIVRSLCAMGEERTGEPHAKQIDGPDPDQFVPHPWKGGGPSLTSHLGIFRSVHVLTRAIWKDRVREDWKRQQKTQPAAAKGVRHGDQDDMYAKTPKAVAAVQQAGEANPPGEGDRRVIDDLESSSELTVIDDEGYSSAPAMLQLVAQQWGLTTNNAPDPHEVQMPLGFDSEDEHASLALRTYTDSQTMLKPTAAKLLVGMQLLAPRNGGLCEIELGTLTEWVNQGKSRPKHKAEREKVWKNARAIRQLEVPEPEDGRINLSHHVQMLEVHPSSTLAPEATVVFGRTRGFQQVLEEFRRAEGPYGSLNGSFVMNADGFMRINGNDSDAARMYLTLCTLFNDRGWDPARIDWQNLEKMAMLANTLSVPAQNYLRNQGGDGNQLRNDRSATEAAIEKLEEYGLIANLEARGRGHDREVHIIPTEEHREAWRRIQQERDRRLEPWSMPQTTPSPCCTTSMMNLINRYDEPDQPV